MGASDGKRKGKPWVCAWDDRDGRRRDKTFEAEEEAREFAARKTLELGQPMPTANVDLSITVAAFGEKWLKDAAPGLKAKTVRCYEDTMERHVEPALGALKVRELHQQAVAGFLTAKLTEVDEQGKRRFKPGTVRLMYATIRRLWPGRSSRGSCRRT